ncbi:MAG: hypothetical protein N2116_05755 [Armatimonadetes bacterium]|nr:hypothetical protein [Armatimonadota bacterium]
MTKPLRSRQRATIETGRTPKLRKLLPGLLREVDKFCKFTPNETRVGLNTFCGEPLKTSGFVTSKFAAAKRRRRRKFVRLRKL